METFFKSVIDEKILKEAMPMLQKLENSRLRALRSDLRRNNNLRESVNSGKLTMERLISLPFEELANEETKRKREKAKLENLQSALHKVTKYSKEEIDIIANKIEDP